MDTANARITVLVENTAKQPKLLAEHGLAYWIEYGGHHFLFDTGQGYVLRHNAAELGIPLSLVEAVVLSHGHYDHTGGLGQVLCGERLVTVYAHPAAFQPKFARHSGVRPIGIPPSATEALRRPNIVVRPVTQPTMIVPGVMATGPIPRTSEMEKFNPRFFLDERCQTIDPLEDDQALFLTTSKGVVILLGCAHSGVINTVRYVEKLLPDQPICALIGGMHLVEASEEQIQWTIKELKDREIPLIAPAHCTGIKATVALWQAFADHCTEACVGKQWQFDLAVRSEGNR